MRMKLLANYCVVGFSLLTATLTFAASLTTSVFNTQGKELGTITFTDSQYGLLIQPNLQGLPNGIHGFHIHEHPDCGNHAMNAGEHLDPGHTGTHQGPYGKGHLGDLPVLVVDAQGKANLPVLAPRLHVQDIQGHAIMIHEGGDNYTDNPKLGGGGARMGCGSLKN